MPLEIRERDGEWCVVEPGTDEPLGCHPTEREAIDQIAAIEANRSADQGESFSVKMDGQEGFKGYTVVWGNPVVRDLQGEYFTPQTDFAFEAYTTRPAIYHHAANPYLDRTIVGVIKSWSVDDTGILVHGVFKRMTDDVELFDEEERELRARYIEKIKEKIRRGELNFSSGAVPHLSKVDPTGRITRWWWAESSFTGSPAEPRMTEVSLLRGMKGFDLPIPDADPGVMEASPDEATEDMEDVGTIVSSHGDAGGNAERGNRSRGRGSPR
jgi:hypothetical protein